MNPRSLLFRLVLTQLAAFHVVGGLFLVLSYLHLVDTWSISFDRHQAEIAKGVCIYVENFLDKPDFLRDVISEHEKAYGNGFSRAMTDIIGEHVDIGPFLEVWHREEGLLYRTTGMPFVEVRGKNDSFLDRSYLGEKWRFYTWKCSKGGGEIVLGESTSFRQKIILPTFEEHFQSLVLLFIALSLVSWLTLRLGLRPFSRISKELANRSKFDLKPFSTGDNFAETQTFFKAFNDLIGRVEAAVRLEKDFLADAAHELRTPITTIRTQLHVLLNARDETERKEVIRDILEGLDQASSLINQLIMMARVESDVYILSPHIIDIVELIQDCIAVQIPRALKRDIDITYLGPARLEVVSDLSSLRSVLNNLIDNAIKYGCSGGQIGVFLMVGDENYTFIVRDDGPGIPPELAERLFERFYRVPGTTAYGSGLGLSIVIKLVERLGGKIRVCEGLFGKGVGFEVVLPLKMNSRHLE